MSLDFDKIREELQHNPGMMLDELAKKIGEAYGVRVDVIRNILQKDTLHSLGDLKSELQIGMSKEQFENFSSTDIQKLATIIKGAEKFIQSLSKKEIKTLKEQILVNKYEEDMSQYISTKIFSENLVFRATHPKTIGDQITGACLGIMNSTQKVMEFLYAFGLGVIQSPFHVYLIVSGKGEYDTWKNI